MNELEQYISIIAGTDFNKIIISNPANKSEEYQKLVIEQKKDFCQISKYTKKQVFHENVKKEKLADRCAKLVSGHYRQVNAMTADAEHIILISKDGRCNYKVKRLAAEAIKAAGAGRLNNTGSAAADNGHNRKKNYILSEGMNIEPLVDMGVFTKDGRVVNSMYDKYKQINRFVEILNDEISNLKARKLNVIDFGCGKSYLTFAMYYYLKKLKGYDIRIIGLDLKKDVIKNCSRLAVKYGYDKLNFYEGSIEEFEGVTQVDMVVTLHACDTATDYAMYKALRWGASVILSVPCCQHELNKQIAASEFEPITDYGILKERFCALATDGIRAKILEEQGYDTQILEFIDMEHTPKNLLIRAIHRKKQSDKKKEKAAQQVDAFCKQFGFTPTLWKLLQEEGEEGGTHDE